jgi:hypothetical protein
MQDFLTVLDGMIEDTQDFIADYNSSTWARCRAFGRCS